MESWTEERETLCHIVREAGLLSEDLKVWQCTRCLARGIVFRPEAQQGRQAGVCQLSVEAARRVWLDSDKQAGTGFSRARQAAWQLVNQFEFYVIEVEKDWKSQAEK